MPGLFEAYATIFVFIAGLAAWIAGSIAGSADGSFGWEAAAVAFVLMLVCCVISFIVIVVVRSVREDARAGKTRS